MTRVFCASTLFGAMTLAAAIDSGRFGGRDERRLLLVSNTTAVPEITPGFEATPAFAALRDRFDEVVRWNDVIAPMHPSHWTPRAAEAPMLSRLFTQHLGLQDGVTELVVESIAVAPARTIGSLLRDCPVTVYSDGLMSYGPTRDELPAGIGRRTGALMYLDLVPGLSPLLLREYDVVPEVVPEAAFRAVVESLAPREVGAGAGAPVILGQYLSDIGLMSAAEELALHDRMVDHLAARGEKTVVFRPHPAARRAHIEPLRRHAARRGIDLVVPDDGLPAETWFATARPSLVVSCFSTALFTAARHHGLEVATVGTRTALERIAPYENSNRVPATIADAVLPRLRADGGLDAPPDVDVARLVRAVGFCMQSNRLYDLREEAATFVAENGPDRWFKKRRLVAVGLAPPPVHAPARRVLAGARRRARVATARVRPGVRAGA